MADTVSIERTRNYLLQIKGSVVFKSLAVVASFLALPWMIHYLGQEQFGVWSTLLSLMSWVVFFDLGINSGLRNKVAESLAKNKMGEAACYVASGYTLIGIFAIFLFVVSMIISFFVPWQTVFNTHLISELTLRIAVQIAIFFIVMNFWIGLILSLLGAVQKTSLISLGQFIFNLLALFVVLVLALTTDASIIYMSIGYGASMVSANIVLSLWFYKRYPELRPKPYWHKHHIDPILSLGLQFFSIQLALLVIYTTDKILITQIFGPQYVTQYEVVFKYFSVIIIMYSFISAPLWSAYTDAYQRGDLQWIKSMLNKQLKIFGGIVIVVIGMVLLAKPVIAVWIGHDVEVSVTLVAAMGIFVLISIWNNVYTMFVNGTGKIKPQLYTAIIAMILNVPLALLFAIYFDFGLSGIVLAMSVSLLIAAIVLPIQVYSMIRL